LKISIKHENLQGLVESDLQQFEFKEENFYADSGIRKAILLVRYTDLMQEYFSFCTSRKAKAVINAVDFCQKLMECAQLVSSEMSILGDDSLQEEIDFLIQCIELESKQNGKKIEESLMEKLKKRKIESDNMIIEKPSKILK